MSIITVLQEFLQSYTGSHRGAGCSTTAAPPERQSHLGLTSPQVNTSPPADGQFKADRLEFGRTKLVHLCVELDDHQMTHHIVCVTVIVCDCDNCMSVTTVTENSV